MTAPLHVVTGGLGYSGRHIVARLLATGCRVRTLTNSISRPNPFGPQLEIHPVDFSKPGQLADSLRGAAVLHNTYWVRFNYGPFSHVQAVVNTRTLFAAAAAAGVGRIVHLSVTNPSLDSPFEYFRGKAELEQSLVQTGLSHAILRPAILFGGNDILINNIAWTLRHLPVFGVFGDGTYRLQPIHVDDLAALAVSAGQASDNQVINAIGPETFTFSDLVKTIARNIGSRNLIVSVPPTLGYWAGWLIGRLMRDVFLTREEIGGLMADLLYVDDRPTGETRLADWAAQNAATLGRRYASELARRR